MNDTVRWASGQQPAREPRGDGANLADILERVLDKGIVIAGDIQVNLLDIELLTIKVRLVVASVDRAKEMGIDWWERDPTLSAGRDDLENENARLRERVEALEATARREGLPVADERGDGSGSGSPEPVTAGVPRDEERAPEVPADDDRYDEDEYEPDDDLADEDPPEEDPPDDTPGEEPLDEDQAETDESDEVRADEAPPDENRSDEDCPDEDRPDRGRDSDGSTGRRRARREPTSRSSGTRRPRKR